MSTGDSNPLVARPPERADWSIGMRIWIERNGHAVLGKGRLELLENIDRCHSISAAARQLAMSYRRAWELVQSINEAAGEPLVVSSTGGSNGGGAELTPQGRRAVAVYRELHAQLAHTAVNLLPRLAAPADACLHLVAAVSLEEVVSQLLTDFALQAPGRRVRAVFGASDALADHLLAGAPADLFLTADPRQLDRLRAAKLIRARDSVPLAENGLAAIGAPGQELTVRQVSDLAGVKAPRVVIAEPSCPLGGYTRAYLESVHLYEPLLRRAVHVENSRAVVSAVRAGQAEVGLVYSSDAARAEGCPTLFHVRRLPVAIRYAAAAICRAGDAAPAMPLLKFLGSQLASHRFRQCGFHPIKPRTRRRD